MPKRLTPTLIYCPHCKGRFRTPDWWEEFSKSYGNLVSCTCQLCSKCIAERHLKPLSLEDVALPFR